MKITVHGAGGGEVTGSAYRVETRDANVLVDCGLFQGRREEAERRNRDLGFDGKSVDAVLLSHAHIDHSGALPVLTKHGFSGQVFATRATADLAEVMLADSAHIQESDCQYVNRKEQRTEGRCRRPSWLPGMRLLPAPCSWVLSPNLWSAASPCGSDRPCPGV